MGGLRSWGRRCCRREVTWLLEDRRFGVAIVIADCIDGLAASTGLKLHLQICIIHSHVTSSTSNIAGPSKLEGCRDYYLGRTYYSVIENRLPSREVGQALHET